MKNIWTLIWQVILLAAIALGSDKISIFLQIPVPGNILGIILIFTLLCLGLFKEVWIDTAATFLLKHMVLLFIPLAVAIMDRYNVFIDYGIILFFALVITFFLPIAASGFLGDLLYKSRNNK